MGERKVLNKYYPPDFDPAKLPKGKRVRSEEKQMKVRMMLPMSVRCNTCGTFMYKGTKFNTRMEDVKGETYLGIKIFRFYYRCTHCSAEFCMKTDPKTADYVVEAGATRNYEPWRDQEKAKVDAVVQREEEERGNAMKALENRTLDSKREMDILSALDEMKSLKARHAQIDTETALAALKRSAAQQQMDLDAEDEEAVRQMLLQRAGFVRRLSDSDEERGGAEGDGGAAGAGPSSAAVVAGEAAAAGGRGERKGKRKLGSYGAPLAGPSVAAAMWEGDDEVGEAERGSGAEEEVAERQGGAEGAAATAATAGVARSGREDGNGGPGPSAAAAVAAAAAAVSGHQPAAGTAAAAPAKPKQPSAAVQPPPLPGFAVKARPVAVVVKRKAAEPAPAPQQQQQQQPKAGAHGRDGGSPQSSGGGGALAGLMGYGSGSGGESE